MWTIFVAGAFLTVASGVLTTDEAAAAIAGSLPVLVFLFALFLFAGALERAGALDHFARWVIGRAHRAVDLPAILFVGFAAISAFLVNDALVLVGVPLLFAVARRLRIDPKPLLLVLAFSVTIGSALTPFGSPQNLLVSTSSGLVNPVSVFLRYLLLPTAVNLAFGAWYLRRAFAPQMSTTEGEFEQLRSRAPPLFPRGGWGTRLRRFPVLWVFPGTMVLLIALDVAAAVAHIPSVPIWETASGGAVLLLLISPRRTQIVDRVNWTVLLLFGGLFVVVAGAVTGGVVTAAESYTPIPGPGHSFEGLAAIVGTSVLGSQIVSNVPWVALQIPLLTGLGYGGSTPVAWVALAGASTLAGNVTLLGAASNLIVVEQADRAGTRLGLGTFVRYGLPLAAFSLLILLLTLYLGL